MADSVTLTAQVRDFLANGKEFEGINFSNQTPAAYFANNQNNKLELGIVGPLGSPLGTNGDPVWTNTRDPGFYNTLPDGNFFNEFWQNVPGLNSPILLPLTFNNIGGGVYSFSNLSFFPIDGKGFGNEGHAPTIIISRCRSTPISSTSPANRSKLFLTTISGSLSTKARNRYGRRARRLSRCRQLGL